MYYCSVPDMSNAQHRFKVDVNAQQHHLTGAVLTCKEENINLIVVEGGTKAVKAYTKLLTRRIDWSRSLSENDEDDHEMDDSSTKQDEQSAVCSLVWQGTVARRAFNNFRFQECRTSLTARKVMETKNVVHYWDMVQNFKAVGNTIQ